MTPQRLITPAVTIALAAVAIGTLTAFGSPDVTRARLEQAIAPTFTSLYIQRAAILGETGITPASIGATAHCDRGGPKVADVGPGADWICMITFTDDHGKKQTGKFEVQARTDSTYVAGGPSKLIGLAMLTARTGNDVPNPVFEFDGAFDPNG
jgi:hypothetical protein